MMKEQLEAIRKGALEAIAGTKAAAELDALRHGGTGWMMKRDDALLRELYVRMKTEGLRPYTLVCYRREPFV